MGGLRQRMPVTFATYAVGMMALAGVPFFFSGFWSKDEILHAAQHWPVSKLPFLLGLLGAGLTAFYMTRQVALVFFGKERSHEHHAHESPSLMTVPLVILAVCTVGLGIIGTPAWPWFESFLTGHHTEFSLGKLFQPGFIGLVALSVLVVGIGLVQGWRLYAVTPPDPDPIEAMFPELHKVLRHKFFFDEIYQATVVAFFCFLGQAAAAIEKAWAWCNRAIDEFLVNGGFDQATRALRAGGKAATHAQTGQVQTYLRVIGVGLSVLVLLFAWGCRTP